MFLIDYFAKPQFGRDSDTLYKARLLTGILLSNILIVIGFLFYLTFFSGLPHNTIIIADALVASIGLFFLLTLQHLKNHGGYVVSCNIVIGSTFVGIVMGVIVSGGPIETPAGMILVLPCVLAFCLMGLRAGLFWTATMLFTNMIGIAFALLGFEYPQISPPEMEQTTRIYNWFVAFLSVIAIVIIYEQMNSRLKKERDQERDRYKHMATHDEMTELANRKLFNESLSLSLARASRNHFNVTLIMIDLNGFKPINDKLGHEAGDQILIHVARQLKKSIRKTDLAARLGGDEFALILEGIQGYDDLEMLLEKFLKAIATPLHIDSRELKVTGSLGVAVFPDQTTDIEELMRFADHAMYYAKKSHLGSKIYETSCTEWMEQQAELEN